MGIQHYINEINREFVKGNSTEHTYRGTLKNLLEELCENIDATNEPKKSEGGNPDYQITKKGTRISVAFIEAKDIDKDLNHKEFYDQFNRYKKAYDNLIITDYLNFQFFEKKKLINEIRLGKVVNGEVIPVNNNFKTFEDYIKSFFDKPSITIKSSKKLAEMMAARARVLQNQIEHALIDDVKNENKFSTLYGHYRNFKEILIHDLEEKEFSDLFAQTLTYGLFAARLYDNTPDDFSRQEAVNLVPKSNPFLKKLFVDIAGANIDERIERTVDNLADIFKYTNIEELLKHLGKNPKTNDPIIHFYETFLKEYDKGLRKDRGVWYTPEPVVKFIVKSVDEILKSDFKIIDGLADTSKVEIKKEGIKFDNRSKNKSIVKGTKEYVQDVHKVQILDPATGTGTFLAEVINFIYKKLSKNVEGAWSSYVENELIPRLNGFELLMAPYAIAHVKLAMLLKESGYKSDNNIRFNVFLTNSLEEYDEEQPDLFSILSEESTLANSIKKNTPVMCLIGNPPYSGISSNNVKWISDLIEDYKYVDGIHFNERKHWLNDDYVKFIRYGQHYIEKNGSGILAFINPHGFLDNPTFRGMRWNLLKTYDKIYTIDLHGNSKKKETVPEDFQKLWKLDGNQDVNVFDIQQGVSINFFVKTGKKKSNELGKVLHYDLYGKRDFKFDFLNKNSIQSIDFNKLPNVAPNYFFVPKDFQELESYSKGFKIYDLFENKSVGFVSAIDKLNISVTKKEQRNKIQDILTFEENSWRIKYKRPKDSQSWKYKWAREDAKSNQNKPLTEVNYRPFDIRYSLYTGKSGGLYARPAFDTMQHFIKGENIGLITARSNKSETCDHFFISKNIMETKCGERTTQSSIFPLYIYHETNGQQTLEQSEERKPNLNSELINLIAEKLDLTFTNEKEETKGTFAPIDILDYIYAVLHSPTYRKRYKEFLKMDFPRVPYPKDKNTFWKLVKLGSSIRKLHLLESDLLDIDSIGFKGILEDSNKNLLVERKMTKNNIGYESETNSHGKVWINDIQHFGNVPLIAWEFFIGGYQPAQKWLKDRLGKNLSNDDINHYRRIIVALTKTHALMKEIDKVKI
tara:strand:+ start:3583 stop:6834 length:3252 start_codon:yes stop_codon:yes gene_type:complete